MDSHSARASSSHSRRVNHGKRRVWSDHEEASLIVALKQIVQEAWKCENGFHPGYQVKLEKFIRTVLPDTDIHSDLHISSKIHVWKRTHGILQLMLSKSGFSWDDNKKIIIVSSDVVWDDFEKPNQTPRECGIDHSLIFHSGEISSAKIERQAKMLRTSNKLIMTSWR